MFEEGLSRFATSDYKHVTNSNRKVGGRGRVLGVVVGVGVGVGLRTEDYPKDSSPKPYP